MKKRLLFVFMTLCAVVSSFALTRGEFVYTHQGRFQIIGANLNSNNTIQDLTGWTVIGEGKSLDDKFSINANGYADGFNSVVSLDATAGEGMYFKFEPSDPNATYIVSIKMKGAALDNVKIRIPGDGYKKPDNLVKIAGNTEHSYTYPSTEGEIIANTAEELTEQWQTFNYAIIGDGTARTWFISFTTMAASIEIADLQIATAMQFADLRLRDAMLEKLNVYKNCYNWPEELLADMGYDEIIEALQAIGDESGQAELEEHLATAQEILAEFLDTNMDDYLAGDNDNYFTMWRVKMQKYSKIGEWNCLPGGRGFWESDAQQGADMGHYAGNNSWGDAPWGVYMQKDLDPGKYVFGIEGKAQLREDATSSSWTLNEAWDPAYGVAYIVKVVDGAAADTIASVSHDLDALVYTPFFITVDITEAGSYEIGYKAYCKDAYKELKNGGAAYVWNASLLGKNENKYNQRELKYEEAVRAQITAGRDALTKAASYLADDTYSWGKAELKAVADDVEPKIAAYEAMSQDDIIATYDRDIYESSTTEESGLLQYTVYQEATKFIIAANNKFAAVNDTLTSMQTAIDVAEATIAMRLYDAATGKVDLQTAIDKAKATQATMKATDYSEENAATIVAANAELADAVETFKASIPATAIATIVDIDFENDAVLDAESGLYTVSGAQGTMEFSTFSNEAATAQEFEKGYWSNGVQIWKGYVRVGNGTGTVKFDPTDNGSMGTNILKVACDFYVQGLSGRNLGFFLKDSDDNDICGLYRNYYDGRDDTNTFEADMSKVWAKSGSGYNNASPADAPEETLTANPLQKTHFEVIMDYGRKSMYCTINSVNGSTSSAEFTLEAIPTQFVLQSNYNNNDRRPWFDNLKIERITAGATDPFVGIKAVKGADKSAVIYNLAGQKVDKNYKGIVIVNGKKYLTK
jgi:hypothetical protein